MGTEAEPSATAATASMPFGLSTQPELNRLSGAWLAAPSVVAPAPGTS